MLFRSKDKIPQLIADGWKFPSMDTAGSDDTNGVTFEDIKDKIYNCNAYVGHEQIQKAIADGADTIITGRAADSALFLLPSPMNSDGPMMTGITLQEE